MHNERHFKLWMLTTAILFLNAHYAFTQSKLISWSGHHHKYVEKSPMSYFEVSHDGKIRVTDDDKDVKFISDGGYLEISKTTFGNRRRLLLEGIEDGKVIRRYYEGRSQVDYEPDGKRWLEDILIDVVRSTGIDAEGRVNRIFSKEGVDGVLDEISDISSNSGQARYFQQLLTKDLNPTDLADVAYAIGYVISSNSERGRLFRKYARIFLADERTSSGFFRGITKISSGSERGSILREVLETDLTNVQLEDLLMVTGSISSNSEKGSILRKVNKQNFEGKNVVYPYFKAVNTISSDSEKSSVLRDLLKHQKLNASAQKALFMSVEEMSSSTEMSSVLRAAMSQMEGTRASIDAFFDALNSISSTTESGRVLRSLIESSRLDDYAAKKLFESTSEISSDTEKGSVLRNGAFLITLSPEVSKEFFKVIAEMSSNTEMGAVLRTALKVNDISEGDLILMLRTVDHMASNTESSRVLLSLIHI